jgi:predicted negative regulator of RcsB-dependent stress response
MNPFTDNIQLTVFVAMTVGMFFGWRIGIMDGKQREQKAQASTQPYPARVALGTHKQRHEKWQKFSGQVK